MLTASKFLVVRIQSDFMSRKKNWRIFRNQSTDSPNLYFIIQNGTCCGRQYKQIEKHLSRKQYLGMPAQCVRILFSLKISQTINGVFEMRSMWIDYLFLFCERFCIGLEWSEAILTFRPYTLHSLVPRKLCSNLIYATIIGLEIKLKTLNQICYYVNIVWMNGRA